MEDSYSNARRNFEMISSSSKCFVFLILIGGSAISIMNLISTLYSNENYNLSFIVWIGIILLFIAGVTEVICFKFKMFASFRGVLFTVLGGTIFFGISLVMNKDKSFYPVLNCE